jgi:hypothetical protein
MAWFRNHYECGDCGASWSDEWSCCCDDDCPSCGSRHWSPHASDDLTFLVAMQDGRFLVLESPVAAEHKPRYSPVAVVATAEAASAFISARKGVYWE